MPVSATSVSSLVPASGLLMRAGRTGAAAPLLFAGLSRPSRILSSVVAALAVCILIAGAIVVAGLHEEAWTRTEQDNRRLATVLAEYTGGMLQAVDLALQGIARDGGLSALDTPERFRAVMATLESSI